jgi:hypothetical protein
MRLHDRQFCFAPRSTPTPDATWPETPFPGGMALRRSPDLPVVHARTTDGEPVALVGDAYQSAAGEPSPRDCIAASRLDDLPRRYASWTGRWALLSAREVHLDAAGLLSVFYPDPERRRGRMVVSSSPSLLHAALDPEPSDELADELVYEVGLDFYVGPRTRSPLVRRLSPSQILRIDPAAGRCEPIPRPILRSIDPDADYARLRERILDNLTRTAAAAGRGKSAIFLPLTAGYDSRLLLAVALKAGLAFETYTMLYGSDETKPDFEIARRLARLAGVRHVLLRPRDEDPALSALWRSHTLGHAEGADRSFMSRGQWSAFPKGALILRGGGFEVGRCFYHHVLPASAGGSFEALVEQIRSRMIPWPLRRRQKTTLRGLRLWAAQARAAEGGAADLRDVFYLEQRLGAWLSSVEQGLDLTGTERLHLSNSDDLFSLLLSLPIETRRASRHHVDMVRDVFPPLAEIPFNPAQERRSRLSRKSARLRRHAAAAAFGLLGVRM